MPRKPLELRICHDLPLCDLQRISQNPDQTTAAQSFQQKFFIKSLQEIKQALEPKWHTVSIMNTSYKEHSNTDHEALHAKARAKFDP